MGRWYTDKEMEFIDGNHGILSWKQMGEKLGRSAASVREKAKAMGLYETGTIGRGGWPKGKVPPQLKKHTFTPETAVQRSHEVGALVWRPSTGTMMEKLPDGRFRSYPKRRLEEILGRKLAWNEKTGFRDGNPQNVEDGNLFAQEYNNLAVKGEKASARAKKGWANKRQAEESFKEERQKANLVRPEDYASFFMGIPASYEGKHTKREYLKK